MVHVNLFSFFFFSKSCLILIIHANKALSRLMLYWEIPITIVEFFLLYVQCNIGKHVFIEL